MNIIVSRSSNSTQICIMCEILKTVSAGLLYIPVCVPYSDKVQGLCYASHTRQLISCSSDGGIVIWNMDVTRQEVRERRAGGGLMERDIISVHKRSFILHLWTVSHKERGNI